MRKVEPTQPVEWDIFCRRASVVHPPGVLHTRRAEVSLSGRRAPLRPVPGCPLGHPSRFSSLWGKEISPTPAGAWGETKGGKGCVDCQRRTTERLTKGGDGLLQQLAAGGWRLAGRCAFAPVTPFPSQAPNFRLPRSQPGPNDRETLGPCP